MRCSKRKTYSGSKSHEGTGLKMGTKILLSIIDPWLSVEIEDV